MTRSGSIPFTSEYCARLRRTNSRFTYAWRSSG
jgi:hypothetical protein